MSCLIVSCGLSSTNDFIAMREERKIIDKTIMVSIATLNGTRASFHARK